MDGSGYIEADELKVVKTVIVIILILFFVRLTVVLISDFFQNFLRDLLKEAKINDVTEDKLIEYTDTMVRTFVISRSMDQCTHHVLCIATFTMTTFFHK